MKTIIEAQDHISKLWSKQKPDSSNDYRMMRYVLRVDDNDDTLLHNVVTGQLIVLNRFEKETIDRLPGGFCPAIEKLIETHFLVPIDFDEHQLVINLRNILRKLEEAHHKPITQYKIFTTTACNARCYYCFEQGIETVTMSHETGEKVINYIASHCQNNPVNITWFGGEPTVAVDRIDQISKGLKDLGIKYQSDMISNGYLFDSEMVERAKDLWNLKAVQISVDGTENNYNRIKAFKNVVGNPYQRILRNVRLLLDSKIYVGLRMNFDIGNYLDFSKLLNEIKMLFPNNRFLQVYAYPVTGEYPNHEGIVLHGDDEWIAQNVVYLNDMARNEGLYRHINNLPFLNFIGCEPDRDDAVVISPKGELARCGEQIDSENTVGNVTDGYTRLDLIKSWKEIADYDKCIDCVFYPKCIKIRKCAAGDRCYFQDRNHEYANAVRRHYYRWNKKQEIKEGGI